MKFNEMNLSQNIVKAINEIGYEEGTEIQKQAIPKIMEGRDIIGQSQTGTGKTASFALPIIDRIDVKSNSVQAVILCPTRELAIQAADEIRKFSKYSNGVKVLAIYGGQDIKRQIDSLKKGVQIVVGTPGRVMDHMRRKSLNLSNVNMIVLDEADEMLSMGFEEDIETILKDVPKSRQTILFSATMNAKILKITKKYLTNPVNIKIKAESLTVDKIEQIAIEMKSRMKDEGVERVIDFYTPNSAIVFCNTKKKVDEVAEMLKLNGYKSEAIHGDIKQNQRDKIIKKLKDNSLKILVATDVAARGIDIKNLDLVINYDLPKEEEYYVHRIGRTGRNGSEGMAITFVSTKEKIRLKSIEKYANTKIKFKEIPDIKEIENREMGKIIDKVQEIIDENKFIQTEAWKRLLKSNNDVEKVAKALFTLLVTSKKKKKEKEIKTVYTGDKTKIVKLFLNVGKKDKISAKDIVGTITAYTDIAGSDIGKVNIMDNFSFVEIPGKYVDNVMNNMIEKQIKGRNVNIEIARK